MYIVVYAFCWETVFISAHTRTGWVMWCMGCWDIAYKLKIQKLNQSSAAIKLKYRCCSIILLCLWVWWRVKWVEMHSKCIWFCEVLWHYVCGSFSVLTTHLSGKLVCLSWTGQCFGSVLLFGNIFGRLDRHLTCTLRYLSVLRGMLGVEYSKLTPFCL